MSPGQTGDRKNSKSATTASASLSSNLIHLPNQNGSPKSSHLRSCSPSASPWGAHKTGLSLCYGFWKPHRAPQSSRCSCWCTAAIKIKHKCQSQRLALIQHRLPLATPTPKTSAHPARPRRLTKMLLYTLPSSPNSICTRMIRQSEAPGPDAPAPDPVPREGPSPVAPLSGEPQEAERR